jgi:hypothetical protein
MDAAHSSEASINIYQITLRNNREDRSVQVWRDISFTDVAGLTYYGQEIFHEYQNWMPYILLGSVLAGFDKHLALCSDNCHRNKKKNRRAVFLVQF